MVMFLVQKQIGKIIGEKYFQIFESIRNIAGEKLMKITWESTANYNRLK